MVLAVADDEVEALVAMLRAFGSLREKTGWPNLRTGMSIEEVHALRLRGVTIVDGHVTKLALSSCGLSGNVAFVRVGRDVKYD